MPQSSNDRKPAAGDCWAIGRWSSGYFSADVNGQLLVSPDGQSKIPLTEIVTSAEQKGLGLPLLLRFDDILIDRAEQLSAAFEQALSNQDLPGQYCALYPIKVNQQRSVIDALLDAPCGVGLEAGSKPELLAVLAIANSQAPIVCNGYKDREYLRLALLGTRMGLDVRIVIEKPNELELLLELATEMSIQPTLGVRARLASIGAGRWQNTGGEKSKFGLHPSQLIRLVERLESANSLHWLKMLHVHMGSQLSSLDAMRDGLDEVLRHFVELNRLGAELSAIDFGGGLAVDYQGTASDDPHSMDYDLAAYAGEIVSTVAKHCLAENLPLPEILTEAGRAMTAHHAVLVTEVVDRETPPLASEDDLDNVWVAELEANKTDRASVLNALAEMRSSYIAGNSDLRSRAAAERHGRWLLANLDESHDSQQGLEKWFCNFSLFQSLPDAWAIEQVFPIAPLQRLHEIPDRRAQLVDLTCDSDGRIDHYVTNAGIQPSLPVHDFSTSENYLLGCFLVGAYQEVLGDIHNLFGDSNAVNIRLTDGGYVFHDFEPGDTTDELLAYVHHDPAQLRRRYAERLDNAGITGEERTAILLELETRLTDDTYLNT